MEASGIHPTSYLLEFCQKSKIETKFDVISRTTGTHNNEFTVKLTCGEHSITKTSTSIKKAKSLAAEEMQKHLFSLPHIKKSEHNTEVIKSRDCVAPLSQQKENLSINKISENYVQELQILSSSKGSQPKYIENEKLGPEHAPVFKIICEYKNFTTIGKEKTKKAAKNLAAKLMLEKINLEIKDIIISNDKNQFSNYLKNDNVLDVKSHFDDLVTEIDHKFKISATKAEKLFLNYSHQTATDSLPKKNKHTDFDYIGKLQKRYYTKDMKNFEKLLNVIMQSCERCINGWDDKYFGKYFDMNEPLALLKNFLKDFDIVYDIEHNYYNNIYNCMISLKTVPNTTQIGFGKTKKLAEISAVKCIAQTILIIMR